MDFSGFFSAVFSQIGDWLNSMLNVIMTVLPDSPFHMIEQNQQVKQVLGWLNWFIPINFMIATMELWIIAVGGFYLWQLLLRFLKAIE